MNFETDINNVEIEPGDMVILPSHSHLKKAYVLYYNKSGIPVLSCSRDKDNMINTHHYHETHLHNSRQYSGYGWAEMMVIEKDCELPDALQKFLKK